MPPGVRRPIRLPATKGHKYRAKATTVDGHRFASKAEARRYGELRLLERAGKIRALDIQPRFPLVTIRRLEVSKLLAGEVIHVAEYVADFAYTDVESRLRIVEDVKGVSTPLYKLKRKWFEAQYGITVTEIRYGGR